MEILRRLVTSSIGRKVIMAVSGLYLGLFLLLHALGNSTIFFGAEVFGSYAHHLHDLGLLVYLVELLLLAIFIIHISFAALLFFANRRARDKGYAVSRSSGERSLGSRTMFYSGLVVLLFILFHLARVRFADSGGQIAELVRSHLSQRGVGIAYLLGLSALALHLSHGFWSLWRSLGVEHPLYNGLIRSLAWLFTVTISAIFLAITLLGFFWPNFLA
ncbi:MAG: succinate dehydrogenase cytochrome b subunit [Thermodesulfobacteriota bacterium]